MSDSIHRDHRKRVKARFASQGLDSMHDHEALELLLFYALPRVDTNPIAHALMNSFGTFHGVLEASPQELEKIDGMGKGSAQFLHLLFEVIRRYEKDRVSDELGGVGLTTTELVGAYLTPQFIGLKEERALLLCLDSKNKVLGCKELTRGTVRATEIHIRKIVEEAMHAGAASVVLSHNHPNGVALPSREDLETTRRVAEALRLIGIRLKDHIIVAEDDFVSLADTGLLGY